ncbi:allophanate hydrolase [Shouchella patagoniensis]|uniref:allophanate hydrolase n=1 Tax=Shouchella patagoniensis TaxID=228576 RepID=UPI0009955F80|nr:allophanate hydrolase [Shouchella patagoniensis]
MEWHTIKQLRSAYRLKQTTPEEVMEELIKCSVEDEDYNIWISPPEKRKLAPFLDHLRTLDPHEAPLWGIPFAVKDNIDVAGFETTAGCGEYAYEPKRSATVIDRLIAAGAIPVGKTNLDQFATGLVGTRSPYGETHNGLRPEYISGGSSSGSAVAVARRLVPFSLGTDTAGSGRIPASLHGLVGFKSSLGAWSTKGVVPACASIDCVTAFTHTIEDARLVDDVIRGYDEEDPFSLTTPRLSSAKPVRYLVPKKDSLCFYGVHAKAYEQAWDESVRVLEEMGTPVDYIDTSLLSEAASLLYDGPLVAERWAAVGDFIASHPNVAFPVTEKVIRSAKNPAYDATALFQAQHRLKKIKRQVWEWLGEDGVLMMPTNGGTYTRDQVRDNPILTNSNMGLYTNHCNLLDLCAIAMPGKTQEDELPFGVTFFATHKSERFIVGAAEAFEQANEPSALLAVCGLHMRGFPLEGQMRTRRAVFKEKIATAPIYKLLKLPGEPAKPGLVKQNEGGQLIEVELWDMPLSEYGSFLGLIKAPLGLGKVVLADGREVNGFICEGSAVEGAEDITDSGGWRNALLKDEIQRK